MCTNSITEFTSVKSPRQSAVLRLASLRCRPKGVLLLLRDQQIRQVQVLEHLRLRLVADARHGWEPGAALASASGVPASRLAQNRVSR